MTPGGDSILLRRAWIYLGAAIVLELIGIAYLKRSLALTHPAPAFIGYLAYYAAFGLLSRVMRVMPASTTYTVWNGLGAAGVTLSGCVFFGDRLTAGTATGIALTVAGAVLINTGRDVGPSRAGRDGCAAARAAGCSGEAKTRKVPTRSAPGHPSRSTTAKDDHQ